MSRLLPVLSSMSTALEHEVKELHSQLRIMQDRENQLQIALKQTIDEARSLREELLQSQMDLKERTTQVPALKLQSC